MSAAGVHASYAEKLRYVCQFFVDMFEAAHIGPIFRLAVVVKGFQLAHDIKYEVAGFRILSLIRFLG